MRDALSDMLRVQAVLAETVTGIYCGWASIGESPEIYQMVMSIGWNPFYKNTEKTAEPWLLHDFAEDFYGKELRLAVGASLILHLSFILLSFILLSLA